MGAYCLTCPERSLPGTSRHFTAARNLVATRAQRTSVKPATNELDLRVRALIRFLRVRLRAGLHQIEAGLDLAEQGGEILAFRCRQA